MPSIWQGSHFCSVCKPKNVQKAMGTSVWPVMTLMVSLHHAMCFWELQQRHLVTLVDVIQPFYCACCQSGLTRPFPVYTCIIIFLRLESILLWTCLLLGRHLNLAMRASLKHVSDILNFYRWRIHFSDRISPQHSWLSKQRVLLNLLLDFRHLSHTLTLDLRSYNVFE